MKTLKMRAAVLYKPEEIRIEEIPVPYGFMAIDKILDKMRILKISSYKCTLLIFKK